MRPHRWQPTRLPHPWDSPSKNTGVGCHFLLQCMKVKSESEVAQSCPTLSDPMDAAHQAPLSMGFSRHEYRINAKSQAFRNLMKSISSNENFLLFNECLFVSDSLRPVDCSSPNSTVQEISQQEYWSELPFPTPGDLPEPRLKLESLY